MESAPCLGFRTARLSSNTASENLSHTMILTRYGLVGRWLTLSVVQLRLFRIVFV